SQTARVELVLPLDAPPRRTPIVVHLAASGETTFFARRQLARFLLRHGIASLILENPYYGSRRPAKQQAAALRTVSDQFAMNFATVEEGRALLRYLHREGFERIAVTGFSQGGVMAAFCAALSDFPVAVAARGAANSVADLFTRDNFSQIVLWERLAQETGDEPSARRYFRAALEVVTVSHFPPPACPEAAVILAGRHDRFVDPAQARALSEHWPGSELRWLEAGHVTALANVSSHIDSIRTALSRLRVGGEDGIVRRIG
ncbi:MAG: alpha/beta hydrolase family protein, partial [Myxococcota bacterium]